MNKRIRKLEQKNRELTSHISSLIEREQNRQIEETTAGESVSENSMPTELNDAQPSTSSSTTLDFGVSFNELEVDQMLEECKASSLTSQTKS